MPMLRFLVPQVGEVQYVKKHPVPDLLLMAKNSNKRLSDIDVSSPHTADRDHSQCERESESGTANQSRVNSPAGQWESGGKDASLMLNPPPPIESCLEGPGGGSS